MNRESRIGESRKSAVAPMAGFEAAAASAIAAKAIPGVVAMAADADSILYEAAFGALGVPGKGPLAVDDVFFIASMTKAITCLAGAQMIEQGKLRLDQDAADFLPEIAGRKVLTGFAEDGTPLFRDPVRPVTVRHLFTHTSGFATDVWNPLIKRYTDETPLPTMGTCRNEAMNVPLVFDPGDRWEYSVSVDWLGFIVERLSGMRLDEYFRRHIFAPIGMEATSFIISPEQRARLVPVWSRKGGDEFEAVNFEISQEPEFFMGGAGLYGTARDYIRFLQMFLNRGRANGHQVIRPETVDLFLANHLGGLTVPKLPTAMPFLSVDIDLWPETEKTWSLGFLTNVEDLPGRRRAGSQFWGGLASTYFWLDPKSRLAGLAMLSYFPFADPAGLAVFDALERDVYAAFG